MEKREIIYLGALLHDIGKFKYRAQKTYSGDNHEKLGEEIIREYLGTKIEAFKNDCEKVISAANRNSGKVWQADCITAGEREEQQSRETRRGLVSIFKRVDVELGNTPNDIYYHEPKPLEIFKDIKDEPELKVKQNTTVEEWEVNDGLMIAMHQASYDAFVNEIKLFQSGKFYDTRAALSTLYSFLWKYTATVCSAGFYSYPDISLFDHSRNVAAIALCLEESDNDNECLLIKGDISGIQKFIYEEIKQTSGAAKKLRGRSFYIKLLTDAVASYVAKELNLFESSIFFNSGGHFVVIAPNNAQNRKTTVDLERKINLMLLDMFGPVLQIALVSKPETADRVVKRFNEVSDELNILLRNAKKHKSFSILKEVLNFEKNENAEKIDFEEIGTKIPYAGYLIEVFSETMPDGKYKDCIKFPNMKSYWKIVNSDKYLEIAMSEISETNPERCVVYSLKNTSILKNVDLTNRYDFPIAFSFKFIATYAPSDESDSGILEFGKLAKIGTEDNPLLAVLRMDVDSLGLIFKSGLNSKKLWNPNSRWAKDEEQTLHSISRLGTLSRELDMFFTKTVNLIAKQHDIYITYSGGDDLFAVGSWVKIIDFAQDVRSRFAHLCNQNPNITISGGSAIIKSGYPIAKAAIIAEYSEKRAKSGFRFPTNKDIGKKNKIDIFGTVVYWEEFFEKVRFANQLVDLVKKGEGKSDDISPSFLYQLLVITRSCFDRKGSFKIDRMHKLTAKLHYHFARRKMTEEQITKETDGLKKQLANYFLKSEVGVRRRWYETFILPASYVILKNRKINK